MSAQSVRERHAEVAAATEAAEREWNDLSAAYDCAAAAEHDAPVSGDVVGSEQHRAAAIEHTN